MEEVGNDEKHYVELELFLVYVWFRSGTALRYIQWSGLINIAISLCFCYVFVVEEISNNVKHYVVLVIVLVYIWFGCGTS
jgi:hypothetical protein